MIDVFFEQKLNARGITVPIQSEETEEEISASEGVAPIQSEETEEIPASEGVAPIQSSSEGVAYTSQVPSTSG